MVPTLSGNEPEHERGYRAGQEHTEGEFRPQREVVSLFSKLFDSRVVIVEIETLTTPAGDRGASLVVPLHLSCCSPLSRVSCPATAASASTVAQRRSIQP